MSTVTRFVVLGLLCVTTGFGQPEPKRIILSPKSNISTAQIAEGFAKYCPNVVLTQNDAKADYILAPGSRANSPAWTSSSPSTAGSMGPAAR